MQAQLGSGKQQAAEMEAALSSACEASKQQVCVHVFWMIEYAFMSVYAQVCLRASVYSRDCLRACVCASRWPWGQYQCFIWRMFACNLFPARACASLWLTLSHIQNSCMICYSLWLTLSHNLVPACAYASLWLTFSHIQNFCMCRRSRCSSCVRN